MSLFIIFFIINFLKSEEVIDDRCSSDNIIWYHVKAKGLGNDIFQNHNYSLCREFLDTLSLIEECGDSLIGEEQARKKVLTGPNSKCNVAATDDCSKSNIQTHHIKVRDLANKICDAGNNELCLELNSELAIIKKCNALYDNERNYINIMENVTCHFTICAALNAVNSNIMLGMISVIGIYVVILILICCPCVLWTCGCCNVDICRFIVKCIWVVLVGIACFFRGLFRLFGACCCCKY
jgi:hypothetical protein